MQEASESTNPLDSVAPEKEATPAPAVPEKADQPKEDPYQRLLSAIEGPDGNPKYDSVEKALMSLTPAQEHIRRLEAENEELRQKTRDVNVSEEIQRGLREEAQKAAPTSAPEDLDARVLELLSKEKQKEVTQRNRELVGSKLAELYGDKAVDVIQAKAADFGLPVQEFAEIANKSPKAFLAYFEQTPTGTPSVPQKAGSPGTPPSQDVKADIMFGAGTEDVLAVWNASRPE